MIDVSKEQIYPLSVAARRWPGGGKHVSALHRYRLDPDPFTRLECVCNGGVWMTSDQAIARCIQNRTTAKLGSLQSDAVMSGESRSELIDRAQRELEAAGI